MADKKFSEFDEVPTPVLADIEIVGLDAGVNARFPGTAFGGVTVHNDLTGRSTADAHPVSAITGLQTELDDLATSAVPAGGTGGQVLAKVDGTDYNTEWASVGGGTVDTVFGRTGTVVADIADYDALYIPLLLDKPAGQPPVVLLIGDSNGVGYSNTPGSAQASNPDIEVWDNLVSGTYDPATMTWKTVNPSGTIQTGPGGSNSPFMGMIKAGIGNAGYAAANRVNARTGRPVLYFSVAAAGTNSRYWLNGSSDFRGWTALTTYFPIAMAAKSVELNGQTYADIVLVSCNTNDTLATGVPGLAVISPTEYMDNINTTIADLTALGIIDAAKTQIIFQEASQTCSGYNGGVTWAGSQYLSNSTNENSHHNSSVGLTTVDTIHFDRVSTIQWGENAADIGMGVLSPKTFVANELYVEQQAPAFRGNATTTTGVITSSVVDGAGVSGHTLNTPNYANATADILSLQRNSVDKLQIDKDGVVKWPGLTASLRVDADSGYDFTYTKLSSAGIVTLGGPNGALFWSRMTGSVSFPAFNFVALSTLSASASLANFGDQAIPNAVGISRTGLVTAVGGFATSASSALGPITGTTIGGTVFSGTTLNLTGAAAADSFTTVGGLATMTSAGAVTALGTITGGVLASLAAITGTTLTTTGAISSGSASITTTGTVATNHLTTTGNITGNDTGAVTAYMRVALTRPAATLSTGSEENQVKISGTRTYNGASFSAEASLLLNNTIISQAAAGFTMGIGFQCSPTLKHVIGSGATIGGYTCINSTPTYLADTNAVTMVLATDVSISPILTIANGGTFGVTLLTHVSTAATLQTGVTVTTRNNMRVVDATLGGGTVTGQSAFSSSLSNATNNTHVLMGTHTVPTGNFAIYQSDAYPSKWGGGQYYKYVGKTASYTGTAADNIIRWTSGTSTFTFPAISAATSGQEYVLRNDSGNNLTLATTGGDTVTPSSVIATATFRRYANNGSTAWFQVG
jgi:hypothetical protein